MTTPGTPAGRIPVDAQFMFSDHRNAYKAAIEKRQRKLLEKIPFIRDFLAPGEKVRLVAPCVSPTSALELLTLGWIFVFINRALLVVTNRGVFHVPTNVDYGYRRSIARFRYEDCKRLAVRGRSLLAEYAGGKKERFLYLPRAQSSKLKAYLKNLTVGGETAGSAGKVSLCPRCARPLAPAVYLCSGCRLPFKDMATAVKASILMPGGGYFYTGHPLLGIADFVVELALLALAVSGLAGMIEGRPGAAATAAFFGAALVLEKLFTIHHARRYIAEYIPKPKIVAPSQAVAA